MSISNNFLGFAEPEEARTDGIFGITRGMYEQEDTYPQETEEEEPDYRSSYVNTKSNQDLAHVLDDEESDDGLDLQKLYNKYAKKHVTFSTNTLEFKHEDVPPLINEQPDPITLTNYRKRSSSKSKSRSRSRSKSNKRSLSAKKKAHRSKIAKAQKRNWKATKGSSYRVKNKKKVNVESRPQWASSTVTSGFFGNKKEINSIRPLEDAPQAHKTSGMKVLQEHQGAGKFLIDFLNEKGQKTGNLKVHKDIASLNEEYENRQSFSMKMLTDNFMKKGSINKTPKSRSQSKPKQRSVSRHERESNVALGAAYGARSMERKLNEKDRMVENQVMKNFKEKESLINMLTKELKQEQERRKLMDKEFKNQFNKFEDEMKRVQNIGGQSRAKLQAKDIHEESLDLIPTKEKEIPRNKAHKIKQFKSTPYKSVFGQPSLHNSKYKNVKSKLKDEMKTPESYKQYQKEKVMKQFLKKEETPKKNTKEAQKPIVKTPKRSPDKTSRSTASTAKKSALGNLAMAQIHQNEIKRQMQLDVEREAAIEVLSRFKQNPNLEMHKVQRELERINCKLDPIMDQVDQQINNVGFTQRLKDQANAVGMVSKIAGRYISFYSDELTDMMLDDILEDTVYEMQHIENQTKKTYMNDQQQQIAQEIMNLMIDYENDVAVVAKKNEEIIQKIPAKKSKTLNPFGTKKPKKVLFEIENEGIDELHDSKEMLKKGYQNPFTSAINRAIDDEYEDDFEEDSKEESKGKPTKTGKPLGSMFRKERQLNHRSFWRY